LSCLSLCGTSLKMAGNLGAFFIFFFFFGF
jgi:hypothetical protein